VRRARTAEPIEVQMVEDSGKHKEACIRSGFRSSCKGAIFRGKNMSGMPDDTAVSWAKMAEPIEMPFGLWTRADRSKLVLEGGTLASPGEYD